MHDLVLQDQAIGDLNGHLDVRGTVLTMELEAASPRLAVSGTGRIDLTEGEDADLTLRFTDTSLDPYARAYQPKLSPSTTVVGSGVLHIGNYFGMMRPAVALRLCGDIFFSPQPGQRPRCR